MDGNLFEEAVDTFIKSLNEIEIKEIKNVAPSYKVTEARKYMNRICSTFDLTDPHSEIVKEIESRFPGQKMFEWPAFYQNDGLFPAYVIYLEALRTLRT